MSKKKINWYFKPNESNYVVEKEVLVGNEKVKKRYLEGVASGQDIDAHGERMSSKCIQGFIDQSMSKEVLLYPYPHGVQQGMDYGRMTKSEVTENGDWVATFELYDGSEGAVQSQVDLAKTVWNQINGLGQYKKKQLLGFSIEGVIPQDGIIKDANGVDMLDCVDLDGVITTPRPAYQASMAEPVFKALGLESPVKVKRDLLCSLRTRLDQEEAQEDYWKKSWRLREALDDAIKGTMKATVFRDEIERREHLENIFNEYRSLMVDLVLQSSIAFQDDDDEDSAVAVNMDAYGSDRQKKVVKTVANLQNELTDTMTKLIKKISKESV